MMIEFELYQPEVAERLQKLQPWLCSMYMANVYMLVALAIAMYFIPWFITNPLMLFGLFAKQIIFWQTMCWCIELYARFCNRIYKGRLKCDR